MSAADRQLERRERLVAGGLELVGTRGWAQTSVRDVCREAGLTERYFYESFADRDALLPAVFQHVADRCTAAVLEAFMAAPDGAHSKVRASLAAALHLVTEDRRIGRVLLLEGGHPELQQLRDDLAFTSAALLAEIATSYFGRDDLDPTEVTLAALSVVGAQAQLATAYLAGRLDVSVEQLIDHLVHLHIAALRMPGAISLGRRGGNK
jgi:AcrR family transcriptional regulator